jgi:hypothetical protein
MAVRAFEPDEPQPPRLTVVENAPRPRQELRRERQRWMAVGLIAMAAPFALALLIVGVVH